MEGEAPLKTEDIKRMIRELIQEQLGQSLQNMEEIRRSPAGAIIRIEEEIKSIKQQIATIQQNMATKDELGALEGRMKGLEGKMTLAISLIFGMLTLYGALVVKFIFFP